MNFDDFLRWELTTRDTIDFKKTYVDMAGDLIAGLLLSQMVYWSLPDKQGNSRLRVSHQGEYWIAKGREDWWDEIRITAKQFDRAIVILEDKGIAQTGVFKFNGAPTKHVRICGENFLKLWFDITQRDNSILPKGEDPFSPKGKNDIPQRGKSLTETTTETTAETSKQYSDAGASDQQVSVPGVSKGMASLVVDPRKLRERTKGMRLGTGVRDSNMVDDPHEVALSPVGEYLTTIWPKKISENQDIKKLMAGVPTNNPIYPSPNELYLSDATDFRLFLKEQVAWALEKGVPTSSLLEGIRNYERERNGWLAFKQKRLSAEGGGKHQRTEADRRHDEQLAELERLSG